LPWPAWSSSTGIATITRAPPAASHVGSFAYGRYLLTGVLEDAERHQTPARRRPDGHFQPLQLLLASRIFTAVGHEQDGRRAPAGTFRSLVERGLLFHC